ncbi:nucleoside-diphosphate-sugar epimerase [Actinocorallia herbida]|uniref:Nucleoside-diphosphate-sugar epimerase n=1 Tax=Actinocorallia herbida TaxID=58109 RepID=A0A3N1CZ17_9ACTN|nr:NAD-dependent epimerase/dehydratase family protein [Actinocorallia herbida]ROO86038.1 nucleoside-diphosphate-sugar epimerase [Actinocorallia herbida]
MNVFLTGATGFIGSGVLSALVAAGHSVTALVRDGDRAAAVRRDAVTPFVGDLRDGEAVRRLAAEADAVITTASPGDATSAAVESAFADAVLAGLRPGATFVRTGGVWVHGSGADLTEDSPVVAPGLVAWREALDTRVLNASGIRSLLVEPGVVYGHGKGLPGVVMSARTAGEPAALVLLGSGAQHWTTIHVDDLAELYVAVLEHGRPGARYLGVSGQNPTIREIGEAAALRRGLDGRVTPEDASDTLARLGAFGEALLLDQQATGERARTELPWKPTRPSLLDVIAAGAYDPS